jgi:hypothetical protein
MNVEQVTERKLPRETKELGENPPRRALSVTNHTWYRRHEAAKPATNRLRYGRRQIACEYMRLVHDTHMHA